eukprot:199773_1
MSIDSIFEYCEGEESVAIGSLILVLANLYISGGNYLEIAISLLEYLKKKVFTNSTNIQRRLLILFQLARAYFKNGRYLQANDIIENRILSNYSNKNKELLQSLEFIQLRVLILINCGLNNQNDERFTIALKLLDDAMKLERKEPFVRKAKINYLKGKVLQAKCFNKLIKKYQVNLKQFEYEKKRNSAKQTSKIIITHPTPNPKVMDFKEEEEKYNSTNMSINAAASDINNYKYSTIPSTPGSATKPKHRRAAHNKTQQETSSMNGILINPLEGAITALLTSHGLYKSIDPIMQAKCCLELSKTYLEIIMEYYALP